MKNTLIIALSFVLVSAAFAQKAGVCTNISNAQKVADAGGMYIEEGTSRFLVPDKPEEVFAENLALLKASPIPILACNSYMPASIRTTGVMAAEHHEKAIQWAETACRRAQIAGIKIIVFGSAGSRKVEEGFDKAEAERQFVSLLKELGDIAKKYDVTYVIEPLNKGECNLVNTVAEGVAIVKKVNHPNVKCLGDIYHMMLENEDPKVIVKEIKHLKHFHVAEKQNRSPLGTFDEDLSPYFNALKKAKYKGGVSIESRFTDFDAQIGKAMKILTNYLDINNKDNIQF